MLGHLRASFGGAGARPGDTIEYSVRALKMTSRGGLFAAVARVGETTLAEAELGFGVGAR
jgi:3-hydroxymyristoyl/3-hydroxydecanoyl-(acyl carrier protein) dehydratase